MSNGDKLKLGDNTMGGYKRPPERTRFRPGTSGNPKGRPKGARSCRLIVEEIARETHRVVENGKVCHRSTLELVMMSLRNLALDGEVSKFRLLHELLQRYGSQEAPRGGRYLALPEPISQ